MKKLFDLSEEVINVIGSIKEKYNFRSEVDTLNYIILSFSEVEKNEDDLAVIKKSVRTAEQEIFIIYEVNRPSRGSV